MFTLPVTRRAAAKYLRNRQMGEGCPGKGSHAGAVARFFRRFGRFIMNNSVLPSLPGFTLQDRFIATLAHELRNPLAPILNALELLRSPEPGDAVEVIERQIRHMARLLDDLLDVSRVTMGKIVLRRIPLDLRDAVRAAARLARPGFERRGLDLVLELPPEPLLVDADPVRIEQIVGNLLNNASKYTDPAGGGKRVVLSLGRDGAVAALRVRDQGIGIPADMLDHIFEPFVQLEATARGIPGGLGLGLSLVRELVAMHGGTVSVCSAGPGQGAEFLVRLPLAAAPDSAEQAGVEDAGQKPPHPLRVLLIEDNEDFAGTLIRLLGIWGHEAKSVSNGTHAVAEAIAFHADAVLLDLGLPGVDGCSVAERLLGEPALRGLRVIALTGYGHETDRARALTAGCEDYLLKPVEPAVLKRLLAKLPPTD